MLVLGHDAVIACEDGDVRRMREGEIKRFVEAFDSGAVVEMRVRNVKDAQRLLERNAEVLFFHFDTAQLDGGTFDSRRHKKDADDEGKDKHENEASLPQQLEITLQRLEHHKNHEWTRINTNLESTEYTKETEGLADVGHVSTNVVDISRF